MMLITAICTIFTIFFQRQFDEKTAELISGKKESAALLADTLLANVAQNYRKRIVSFSNPMFSSVREEMIRAFADRDREKLLVLSQPLFEGLQRENPYFSTVGWILPDNHVFLRTHNPEKYGDDIGHSRADIAAVNRGKKQQFGFDIGTKSMQYRVAHPVFFHNEYLGVVQFGIKVDVVLDALRDKLKTISGMAVVNEEFDLVTEGSSDRLKGSTHTIVSDDISAFGPVLGQLDWSMDQQRVQLKGRPYVILKILSLKNFQNENLGFFFVALDISAELTQKRNLLLSVFLLSSVLLVVSFLILYFSYGSLIQRIINLNQSLERNNLELENRVHERTAKLQESEERLQQILDQAPVGILIADLNSRRIQYANPAICTMLGYGRKILDRHTIDILHPQHELSGIVKEFKEKGKGIRRVAIDIPFVRKDGTTFEADVISSCFELDKRLCVLGFIVDQTETKKMAIQLHRAQKMEAIGLMAGGVAHDLNNILSGIVSYPELLLLQLPEGSAMREPLTAIRESGLRAAAVVADLLTVARGAASVREPHDINLLIQEYLDSPECRKLKSLYSEIIWDEHLLARDSTILCSPMHIKKTIMNLLTNAAEAVGSSGHVIVSTSNQKIHFSSRSEQHNMDPGYYLLLTVEDNGPGIADNNLEHIFEPFYTRKEMGQSGTGLGLSVVWNTVQDHKGKIFVESSKKGTCFQLYFPVCREERGATSTWKREENVPLGNGESLLVVDDEAQLRDIASQMLLNLGYKVESVCSGELACKFLADNRVDLIVIDMQMEPGMNGRQTYEKILEVYPGQRAIIASGYSESDEVKAALELGAGGFIKKPYSMDELGRAVRQALLT